jgi:[protein-PII] uridylyltransferase
MTTVANPHSEIKGSDPFFLTALAERSAQVDGAVLAAAHSLLAAIPEGLSLLAVGGYGRRHLFPYSDVDLLLLFASERLALANRESVAAFLRQLWDAGLRVSQSVHTPQECLEVHDQNVELNISLLDRRFLAGDRALYAGLEDRMPRFLRANREILVRNLARLTRERHAKFGDTLYHLEPNLKETPGGLRDFQLVAWLEQLRGAGSGNPAAPAPAELAEAFDFLARVRCYLHYQAGRDSNVIAFDAQESIADEWQPPEGEPRGDASAWMRQYFRHARTIHRAALRALESAEAQASSLFSQFRDWRTRLANADFSVHRERAHFRAPQQLDSDPQLALRLFEFVARHGIGPSLEAERQIEARLPRLREVFAGPRPLWELVESVLSLPQAPMAVRAMHDTGLLTAVFPELRHIDCLVIRDFFHRYTVDEHTLVAMQNLCGLRSQAAASLSFGGLLDEVKQPGLLLFALLFHDAGKGCPAEGHVDGSLRLAESAMGRIGVPRASRELVRFLIASHLELSAVLQSRDVYDPATIREVARRVETAERLKSLTLLTWADIGAVNPEVMTPWRAEQLWQLYLMVYNELTRELESDRIADQTAGSPERAAFLEGFPVRYLRTHTEAEIDAHMELERHSRERGAAVDVRRLETAWQLTLVTGDRPGLFAAAAGTLSSFGMNILKAEAFANRRGLVLDTFTFADPNRTLDLNPSEVDRLRSVTGRVLAGRADASSLLRDRPKPKLPSRKAAFPARVTFDPGASAIATLVEIVAQDRPGLLYDLASAISSCGGNIEVVLIDTEAHKAIDVFYVTAGGRKLDAEKQAAMAESLRRACEPVQ